MVQTIPPTVGSLFLPFQSIVCPLFLLPMHSLDTMPHSILICYRDRLAAAFTFNHLRAPTHDYKFSHNASKTLSFHFQIVLLNDKKCYSHFDWSDHRHYYIVNVSGLTRFL